MDERNKAEEALNAAQSAILALQESTGRGLGGRELSLVNTKIEEAMLWLSAFDKSQEND